MESYNSRPDKVKERISKSEGRAEEFIQPEEIKEKKVSKRVRIALGT